MTEPAVADRIALEVNQRLHEMLDREDFQKKLICLAYCERQQEKWLVFELYCHLSWCWQEVLKAIPVSPDEPRDWWEMHLELPRPENSDGVNDSGWFDLAFGNHDPSASYVARQDTLKWSPNFGPPL
jgi:hypothetical protein